MGLFDFFHGQDIGIDLGTTNILVFVKGKGIVLNEPSVIAIEKENKSILAVGSDARMMLGRTPGNITAVRPLKEGVIADYDATEAMLRYFIEKATGKNRFNKPRIMICIPAGVTTVEKRAVLEAAAQAGGKKVYLIEEPLAAALGAGLDIAEPCGTMVVDIGGGTADVAVLSLGGIVIGESVRIGGDKFDDAIMRYAKKEYNLLIGERTAEEIKIRIGSALPRGRAESMDVRGRDLISGLPKVIRMTSVETQDALAENVGLIVDRVKAVLEKTPPELSADIIDRGIVMTGGGSLLHGLDQVISQETGIPVYLANDTLACVAIGTGKALDNLDALQEGITNLHRSARR